MLYFPTGWTETSDTQPEMELVSEVVVWLSPEKQNATFLSVVEKWRLNNDGTLYHPIHGECLWRAANL
jgi:hypothetical protein